MASFKAGGSGRSQARPCAAHDRLSLSSHRSPVISDAGDGRLT